MTRYLNPFAFFAELIAKAFATLDDRDNAGGRSALVAVPSRSRARRSSRAPTPQTQATSIPGSAELIARSTEKSGSMPRRRHTDTR